MIQKRPILLFLILISFLREGYSQNIFFDLKKTEKRADIYYSRLSYSKAIELYSEALLKKKNKGNYSLNKKAADLYRKMGRYEEAKNCFDNLLVTGYVFSDQDSIDYYNISRAVSSVYTDSNAYSRKILNGLFRDTLYYDVSELPFNTEHSEYCPVPFKNGLLYVSDEAPSSLVKKYNSLNNGGFASMYYAEKKDTLWIADQKVRIEIEKALHVGPIALYDGQKKALVNVCIEDKKKPYRLLLYTAEYEESAKKWKIISSMPFNNKSYSVGHPAVSEDGKKIFFISDMAGGKGGTDLYTSSFLNGKWTTPVNMGSKINTKGNEKYPYINNDNVLFFSTDGRYGIGGSDIYYVDLDFADSLVLNMGFPVNSNLDDFGFNYDPNAKTGYFSSNRKSKGKQDDLYLLKENKIFLNVYIKDDLDKSVVENAEVQLWDSELNIPIKHYYEKTDKTIHAWLRPNHQYKMSIKKEDYKNDTLGISTYGTNDYTKFMSPTVFIKRKSIYYASIKLHNEKIKESPDSSFIVVNNITNHKVDTIQYIGIWYKIKLDSECEYIITSRSKDSLRYIFVEKKPLTNLFSKPYYNMYLSSAKSFIVHVILKKCAENKQEENSDIKIKAFDWVNGNEFYISPGPDGDFQFVVTDYRLFDFYVNGNRILYSKEETQSDGYCVSFMEQ